MRITLKYRLDAEGRKSALLAGQPAVEFAERQEEVESLAPFVDVLTVDEKGTPILGCSGGKHSDRHNADSFYWQQGCPVFSASPTVDQLAAHVRERRQAEEQKRAEEKAKAEATKAAEAKAKAEKQAAHDAAYATFLADQDARGEFSPFYPRDTYATVSYGGFKEWTRETSWPLVAEAIRRDNADREERERIAAEAKAAKEQADRSWREAFLSRHGNESQQKRFAAGLLPAEELQELVERVTLAPLAGFEDYQKLTAGDVPCACEYDTCKVSYHSEPADAATAQEWERTEAIRAACEADEALKDAEITLRRHIGEREDCEATVSRTSVLVEAQAGPHEIRHNYAA